MACDTAALSNFHMEHLPMHSPSDSGHPTLLAHLASGSHSGPPSMMTSREAVGT